MGADFPGVCASQSGPGGGGRRHAGARPEPRRTARGCVLEGIRWRVSGADEGIEAAPEPDAAAGWHGLPPGAVGAVVLAWRLPGAGELAALTLVALDARRFPVREARSTVGSCAGAMFRAGDRGDEGAVRVWADEDGQPHANGWLETPWLEVLGRRLAPKERKRRETQ